MTAPGWMEGGWRVRTRAVWSPSFPKLSRGCKGHAIQHAVKAQVLQRREAPREPTWELILRIISHRSEQGRSTRSASLVISRTHHSVLFSAQCTALRTHILRAAARDAKAKERTPPLLGLCLQRHIKCVSVCQKYSLVR